MIANANNPSLIILHGFVSNSHGVEQYSHPFENSDVIDLETETIVEDHGEPA
jgi:hypothetical protein